MKLSVRKKHQDLLRIDFSDEVARSGRGGLTFLVGRAPDCHVSLDDKQVSREHASLNYKDGQWTISLISSFGKLMVNGEPTLQKRLQGGDVVEIPPFFLTVDLPGGRYIEVPERRESDNGHDDFGEIEDGVTNVVSAPVATNNLSNESPHDFNDAPLEAAPNNENIGGDHFGGAAMENVTNPQMGLDEMQMGGGDLIDSGDKTGLFRGFSKFELEIFGEYAPYDRYHIEANETFIGRDSIKCQIILLDPEVSSVHSVVRRIGSHCEIEDLKSSNGTIHRGVRINKATLMPGDEFIIGSTTFTFKAESLLLQQEMNRLMPVEENQEIEVEEVVEVASTDQLNTDFGTEFNNTSSSGSLFSKDALKDPQKRKKLMIGAIILLLLWVLLEEEEPKKKADPKGVNKASNRLVEDKKEEVKGKNKRPLNKEELELISVGYELAKSYFDQGMFREAILELDKIFVVAEEYKNARQLYEVSKKGLAELEELERKRQQEIEKQIKMKKVKELVERAKEATKERKVVLAEALFTQIIELDPENYDVAQFRLELDAWKKEEERLALEKAQKEAERKRKIEELQPGKKAFLQKNWHDAIVKLHTFLDKKEMDDDLVKEGTDMLTQSQASLSEIVDPLLGKARSLKEGQDLKGSYENYQEILKHDPGHQEAMVEMDEIKDKLFIRARKIYREAIIAESLSLFHDAKEKFQEVQQVAPKDSEYYKKASDRLKDYLE